MKEIKDVMKTGTTTVDIICKDGVVLAADKRASAGYRVADKNAQKLHIVADKMAVTIAGLVSDAQFLVKLIRAEIKLSEIQSLRALKVNEAANLLAGIQYRNIRVPSMVPGIVGFLMGGYDSDGPQLYDIGIDGSVAERKDFYSDGSGSSYALGFLEQNYKQGINLEQGTNLAVKAISSALQRDIATGNGVVVFTINNDGVTKVFDKIVDGSLI